MYFFSILFSAWVLFLLYCTLFVRSLALPHTFNDFHFNTIWWSFFCHFPCLSINLIELKEFAHYLFWLRIFLLNTLRCFTHSTNHVIHRSPTTIPSFFGKGKEAMGANNAQHMDFYILFLSHSLLFTKFYFPLPSLIHISI